MPRSRRAQLQRDSSAALVVASQYVGAFASGDQRRMHALRAPTFSLDFVHLDAYAGGILSTDQTKDLWSHMFDAFPEMDYRVTRTIAADTVVVTEWTFTGTHGGPLGPPVLTRHVEPTGRTIRFRGVSVYEVADGLIQRETSYLDFATFLVELGVEL